MFRVLCVYNVYNVDENIFSLIVYKLLVVKLNMYINMRIISIKWKL